MGQILSGDLLGNQRIKRAPIPRCQALLSVLLGQHISLFTHGELVFPDVLCAVKEVVAARRAADGHGTPALCLHIRHSGACCVYPELGAYPWRWCHGRAQRKERREAGASSGHSGLTRSSGRNFLQCVQATAATASNKNHKE